MNKLPDRATRDGFGDALLELGRLNPKVLALTADLTGSVRMSAFQKAYPHRFWNLGIMEQTMVGVAAGLSVDGWIPFVGTYGSFFARAIDQIRVSVAINQANVKLVSSHGGLAVGEDGGSAQALEDIAMIHAIPNLTILSPCDAIEAKKATLAAAEFEGPIFLRLARQDSPILTTARSPFVIGRAETLRKGEDLTIFGHGPILAEALAAAAHLEKEYSIQVVNLHTIKPLDKRAILDAVRATRAAVVVEDHQILGGLGSAIAQMLAENDPVPMTLVGVRDRFGESGTGKELWAKHGLDKAGIIEAVHKTLKRKSKQSKPKA